MTFSSIPLMVFLVPLIGSLVCVLLRRKPVIAQNMTLLICATCAVLSLLMIPGVLKYGVIGVGIPWIDSLGINFDLAVDSLSTFTVITIAVLMTVDIVYTRGYMSPHEARSSFYGWTLLFLAAMVGAVMATDLIQFYFLWELMLLPSTALIVFWGGGKKPEATGFKYFIVTHVGAALILIATLWIITTTGESNFFALQKVLAGLSLTTLRAMATLFVIGFAVKMAIFPAHIWLPDAHSEAPLPVSVMLSAIMMNMGIYGIIRFLFTFFPGDVIGILTFPLMLFGLISQWYGGLEALGHTEMKRIAAYSTVSQMGYVLFGIATMSMIGLRGSIFHMLNHGTAKALLFMSIGAVIHSTGATHLDRIGGMAKRMPWTALCCTIAAFALAGAPPFGAFQSEWPIFAGGFSTPYFWMAASAVCASVLTAFYVLRLVIGMFFGREHNDEGNIEEVREAPLAMLVSMLLLAVSSLAVGVFPEPFHKWIEIALKTFGRY